MAQQEKQDAHQPLDPTASFSYIAASGIELDRNTLPAFNCVGPSIILPQLTLAALDATRASLSAEHGTQVKLLVVDNNPFNGMPPERVQAELQARPWLRVVDHHGIYNDGVKRSAFPRLVEQLPQLCSEGFMDPPLRVITDQGNVDPDGILSQYLALNPALADDFTRSAFLSAVCRFTDFTMFGGEQIDAGYHTEDPVKRFSYALLQLINEEKQKFVEHEAGTNLEALSAAQVRGFFMGYDPAHPPKYDSLSVQHIYQEILTRDLPVLLKDPQHLPPYYEALADAFEARLRFAASNALRVTSVWNGKLAYMLPSTGYQERLDKARPGEQGGYIVHDWLAESVAQYATDAPVHLRMRNEFYVLSLRHPRFGEAQEFDYDVMPAMKAINKRLGREALYGRKEVALGKIPANEMRPSEVLKIIKSCWKKIERPLE